MKRFLKTHYLILIITLLAIFLRFYRINDNFIFDGEIGDNLLAIRNAFTAHTLPLIGPPTSHPWLSFGPLFYWIYGPILILSKWNPLSHAYFGALIGILIIPVHYWFVYKLFDKKLAVLSSFFIAISPLFVDFAHTARFINIASLVIYPTIALFYDIVKKNHPRYFLFGLSFGILLNFHYSPLMLIPFFITCLLIKKIKLHKKSILHIILGASVALSPVVVHYALFARSAIPTILLWIPYRIAGFFGIVHKNTVSPHVIEQNSQSLFQFLTKSIFPLESKTLEIMIASIVILSVLLVLHAFRKVLAYQLLLLWFTWGIVAVFLHGDVPMHYYLPLFPLPILFISIGLLSFWKRPFGKVMVCFLLLAVTLINMRFYFSPFWFYRDQTKASATYYTPFPLQQEIVTTIIQDSKGKPFQLRRVGVNDQFSDDFAQNYLYLLAVQGRKQENKAKITYTIYDNPGQPPVLKPGDQLFFIKNIWITKQN